MDINSITNYQQFAVSSEGAPCGSFHKVIKMAIIDAETTFIRLDNGISFLLDWTNGLMPEGVEVSLTAKVDENSHPYYEMFETRHPDSLYRLYQRNDNFYQIIG